MLLHFPGDEGAHYSAVSMTQTAPNALELLIIDARGLSCPLPVLRLNKALKNAPPGTQIALLATDPAARRDVPAFCAAHGYPMRETREDGHFRFHVHKIA